MAWSNSAHNVFLELFAELGWLGVMLLGVLVFLPMLVVFLSGGWPIALSLFGIWFTLSVDVTSSHAYMMALAFAVLGATYAAVPKELRPGWKRLLGSTSPAVQVLVVGAVVCIALWWFLPCVSAGCATVRYRGHPAIAAEAYRAASPQERELLLADLRELYPQSMWVVHLAAIHAVDRTERLALTRELSTRFPYLSPEHYMTWARDAFAANDREGALRALESGFVIFPADRLPFGEMRMSPERYRTTWVEPATRLLGQLQ